MYSFFSPVPVPTLDSSIFIPPVPYFKTFSANHSHFSNGFIAIHIGSIAGLSAVHRQFHSFASSIYHCFSSCLDIFKLLGNQDQYARVMKFLISNPASSIALAIL